MWAVVHKYKSYTSKGNQLDGRRHHPDDLSSFNGPPILDPTWLQYLFMDPHLHNTNSNPVQKMIKTMTPYLRFKTWQVEQIFNILLTHVNNTTGNTQILFLIIVTVARELGWSHRTSCISNCAWVHVAATRLKDNDVIILPLRNFALVQNHIKINF